MIRFTANYASLLVVVFTVFTVGDAGGEGWRRVVVAAVVAH